MNIFYLVGTFLSRSGSINMNMMPEYMCYMPYAFCWMSIVKSLKHGINVITDFGSTKCVFTFG